MKKNILYTLALVIIALSSCKKKDDPTVGFSEEIQKIVPDEILTDVKAKGMAVNEGKVPPNIEGIYVIKPMELMSPYGKEDPWEKGRIIDNYYYKFSNQSSDKKTLVIDYTNGSGDIGAGLGSFVSGNGKKFTIFAEASGVDSGVKYVMLTIISGELNEKNEIKNLQSSIYMKEKSEDSGGGTLIPVNTGRIWFDNDKISERTNTFPGKLRESNGIKTKSSLVGSSF